MHAQIATACTCMDVLIMISNYRMLNSQDAYNIVDYGILLIYQTPIYKKHFTKMQKHVGLASTKNQLNKMGLT